MFTINQLIAHLIGDYLLQNHWMAINKTKRWIPAIVHSFIYTIPFAFITQNPIALSIIMITHMIEDHYYLIKHFITVKNRIGNGCKIGYLKFNDLNKNTGYPEETPEWLAYSLLFIQDNILHILINAAAIYYIG